ncbi:MAG: DUF3817 domain-containing protein [Actinomycetota bacterium]|nr:DUF3817 domain-containing protein [Actinomycetota bacterium]
MKKTLRIVAVLEAISFLVLLVATVVKETGGTAGGVRLMGPVHGVLFLVYALLVLLVASDEKWALKRTLLTLLCAVLPFGGFVADAKLIGPAESTASV